MSVAHQGPRCSVAADSFLIMATRELREAVDEVNVCAALLDAQLAQDPAMGALREVARSLRVQAQLVSRMVDDAFEGGHAPSERR